MVVCRFWLSNGCRFGDSCKNEHPPKGGGGGGGFQQNQNRFGPLSGSSNSSGNAFGGADRPLPYMLKPEIITDDLTKERPQWILSAYGPGRGAPVQLFGGMPREQSFEEMRLHHYQAVAAGNPQQAIQEAQGLVTQSEQQMQTIISNVDGAIKFVLEGANTHPNRLDIVSNAKVPDQPASSSTTGAFGQPPAPATGGFGQAAQTSTPAPAFGAPSALGSAFGKPSTGGAFGHLGMGSSTPQQPSQPSTGGSAFGQPTQLGAAGSAFGKPSLLGGGSQASPWGSTPSANTASPFGQPSSTAPATSAFGQSSQLGASSAFGQPSALGASSAFGKPSQLGGNAPSPFSNTANTASAFGSGSGSQAQPGIFGQASSTAAPSSSPFGQPSAPPSSTGFSGFGQPSAAGQTSTSPFGQPAQPSTQPPPNNPFGAPSQPRAASPFGAPSQPATNPFGGAAAAPSNPFAATTTPAPIQHSIPQGNSNSTRDPSTNRLTTFHGQPVYYPEADKPSEACIKRPGDGKWEKVWFSDGPPQVRAGDTELPAELYDEKTRAVYEGLREGRGFGDGGMPWLPPRREWVSWDF